MEAYLGLFVAAFLGFPSIGLVKARVVDCGEGTGLRIGSAVLPFPPAASRRLPGRGRLIMRRGAGALRRAAAVERFPAEVALGGL